MTDTIDIKSIVATSISNNSESAILNSVITTKKKMTETVHTCEFLLTRGKRLNEPCGKKNTVNVNGSWYCGSIDSKTNSHAQSMYKKHCESTNSEAVMGKQKPKTTKIRKSDTKYLDSLIKNLKNIEKYKLKLMTENETKSLALSSEEKDKSFFIIEDVMQVDSDNVRIIIQKNKFVFHKVNLNFIVYGIIDDNRIRKLTAKELIAAENCKFIVDIARWEKDITAAVSFKDNNSVVESTTVNNEDFTSSSEEDRDDNEVSSEEGTEEDEDEEESEGEKE